MISKFNLSKALLEKAQEVADLNSYLLIKDGESYTTDPNVTYIEEYCIYGNDETIGLANNSSDIQFGIYQLSINTPKSNKGCKWLGLEIADVFSALFTMGLQLTYDGQMVEIIKTSISPPLQDDTHMAHVLSIRFNVIN